jgi:hypothetical protein
MKNTNRITMNKDEASRPDTIISRRTGLDRRWIPSADHQPERRRGRDRRADRKRSFSKFLELNTTEEKRELFPEINAGNQPNETKKDALPFDGKRFSPSVEIGETSKPSDDG